MDKIPDRKSASPQLQECRACKRKCDSIECKEVLGPGGDQWGEARLCTSCCEDFDTRPDQGICTACLEWRNVGDCGSGLCKECGLTCIGCVRSYNVTAFEEDHPDYERYRNRRNLSKYFCEECIEMGNCEECDGRTRGLGTRSRAEPRSQLVVELHLERFTGENDREHYEPTLLCEICIAPYLRRTAKEYHCELNELNELDSNVSCHDIREFFASLPRFPARGAETGNCHQQSKRFKRSTSTVEPRTFSKSCPGCSRTKEFPLGVYQPICEMCFTAGKFWGRCGSCSWKTCVWSKYDWDAICAYCWSKVGIEDDEDEDDEPDESAGQDMSILSGLKAEAERLMRKWRRGTARGGGLLGWLRSEPEPPTVAPLASRELCFKGPYNRSFKGTQDLLDADVLAWCDNGDFAHCERIDLQKCYQLTDLALIAIGRATPLLHTMDISDSRWHGDVGMAALARGCPKLSRAFLSGCDRTNGRMTDAGMAALEGCAHLRTVDVMCQTGISEKAVKQLSRRGVTVTTGSNDKWIGGYSTVYDRGKRRNTRFKRGRLNI
ncbi:hypothetical protein CYMTET_14605 [Cymbomonas tetramitiformis]|uniref:Uncharacterized protein n=1 Tax=Cymbomonas tetramitiformis TaxID=36881 RepID=A0AAE0LA02_9CHLO|nr:hypothetical protein CYMTET_14605 [Cymbomonas tetramitiformis]